MKNKLAVIIISILIIISVLTLSLLGDKAVLKQSYGFRNSKDIAIMVWNENSSKYEKSSDIPRGDYMLSSKSFCKNGSQILNYNNNLGTIEYSLDVADKCYLYFDSKRYLAAYVESLSSTTEKVSSQDGSAYAIYSDSTVNNNVRYSGKDPDNYVTFSGTLWRIVGAFKGNELGMDTNKTYAKIITDDSIGNYAWDSNSANADWSSSTLNTYLNGTYYNSINPKDMIVKANWFTGGPGEASSPFDSVSGWYTAERTKNYNGFATAIDYSAFIGLSYPSDYGLALYDGGEYGICSIGTMPRDFSACDGMSWMTKSISSRTWTLLKELSNENMAYYSYSGGGISNTFTSNTYEVFPTLYLHNNVYITGGDGSKANPYTLGFDGVDTLSDTIIAKSGATTSFTKYTSSQDSSIYRIVDQNGHRYEGPDPDNYVKFNNEEWRIIGTFDGSTIGQTSGTYYPKLLRSTSHGTLAWNTTSSNTWSSSSLYSTLQSAYSNLNPDPGTRLIVIPTWRIGGFPSSISGKYTPELYSLERGSLGANNSTSLLRATAPIGLMYPSDYGYSAYSTSCDNTSTKDPYNYEQNSGVCSNASWIFVGGGKPSAGEWFITPCSDNSTAAVAMQSSGWVSPSQGVTGAKQVRPSVYLKTEVKVIGGNGSKAYPYILSL